MAQRVFKVLRTATAIGFAGVLAGVGTTSAAQAREVVTASAPQAVAVTIYRDPDRGPDGEMDRDFPRGFALITERRTVTLPRGDAVVRFNGVTEGMVAVSALVTGLPHKVEEQNRNASLLSPAALVDGSLGNRVTVTRTNPATGVEVREDGVVRTRADGGLVLQTRNGFEAVRCSGLAERLSFDAVPEGLSAQPVYSLSTQGDGGTHTVELTYLSWGFDWQAHHVARITDRDGNGNTGFGLLSWLTVVNSNGQSFDDAELLVVAGKLNVVSNYEELAQAPQAQALQLECFPFGSTAQGSKDGLLYSDLVVPPMILSAPPPSPTAVMMRSEASDALGAVKMVAQEEQLGDLKLFRVPEPVTVAAQGQKQVAFLVRDKARGSLVYEARCTPSRRMTGPAGARLLLESVNDAAHGLDASLPLGGITVFENGPTSELLLAEDTLGDTAKGQNIAFALGESTPVQAQCFAEHDPRRENYAMRAVFTNAKDEAVKARLVMGEPGEWRFKGLGGTRLKDGETVHEVTIPANSVRTLSWTTTSAHQKK